MATPAFGLSPAPPALLEAEGSLVIKEPSFDDVLWTLFFVTSRARSYASIVLLMAWSPLAWIDIW